MGVRVGEFGGEIVCKADKLTGGDIYFDFPSVGATENIILAAVLAEGRTVIHNAAKEPEVEDLQNFINSMGGKVAGAGSSVITVDGDKKTARNLEYKPLFDRIEPAPISSRPPRRAEAWKYLTATPKKFRLFYINFAIILVKSP